jgi:hypothetical protein
MPHHETLACLRKAEPLIEAGDVDSLRYATLQLRMAIEYLFYELVPLYRQELPDDILTAAWQPQRILDALLECDPHADKDGRIAIGPSEGIGEPGWADFMMESKAPNKKLLKKHYHRLGFYLHAPVDLVDPSLEKWRNELEKAAASLSEFKSGQVLSNFRKLIDFECVVCKRMIYRNKLGVEATGEMQCLNPECKATYDVRLEGELTHYSLRQESFDCRYCGTKNYVPAAKIVDGVPITCVECEKRVVVRSSFRLQPLDDPPARATPTDADLFEFQARAGNAILARLNAVQRTGDVDTVANAIYSRIVDSGSTLMMLQVNELRHDWKYDAASILRTIYDASLQALYILNDPTRKDELARRYIDFGIIEKVRLMSLFDKQANGFAKRMAQSPRRTSAEPAILAEHGQVMQKYGYDKLKEPPKNWFKGSLRDVAKAVGYEAEYELLQKQLSGVVHSSFLAIEQMPGYEANHVVGLYWIFAFRVLGKIAEHAGVQLDATEQKLVERSVGSIFDW